jgi:hypothetical protein
LELNRKLFRTMYADEDLLPHVGEEALHLGVRLKVADDDDGDIPKDADGLVHPQTGGMSVAVDAPENLPPHRRPKWLPGGKSKKGVLFCIERRDVPNSLEVQPDGHPHHVIEPKQPMPLRQYQDELASTRPYWNLIPEPGI